MPKLKSKSLSDQIQFLLGEELSTLELHTTLNTIFSQLPLSNSDSLLLSSVLFSKIIPDTYTLMDDSIKNVIHSLIASRVGISQLIQTIKLNTNIEHTYIFIDIFIKIIKYNLKDLIDEFFYSSELNLPIWKSILTIKIPEIFGFILVWLLDNNNNNKNYSDKIIFERSEIRLILEKYKIDLTTFILENVNKDETKLQYFRQIINSFLLNDSTDIMKLLLNHWNSTIDLYSMFESKNRKLHFHFIESQKFLCKGIIEYMNTTIDNLEMINLWQNLMSLFFKNIKLSDMKSTILLQCEKCSNIMVSYVLVKLLGNINMDYTLQHISKFGNKEYIINTYINKQTHYTQFIILLLKNTSDDELQQLSTKIIFLNSISTRLESKSQQARELGMIIADYVYMRVNDKIMFSIPSYNSKREQFMDIFTQLDNVPILPLQNFSVNNLVEQLEIQNKNKSELIQNNELPSMSPIMIEMDYNSDDEDTDLDDPSVHRKPTIAKPVFLKDLLHYLTSDPQKDTTSFDKKGIAFSIGIEMARIKKNTPEMKFYCSKLIDAALNLESTGFVLKDDKLDEDEIKIAFDSWRLSFMIAICTSEPDIVFEYLSQSFIKQDWNIPTRIQVLTCIGLSCRELCGKDDTFIWGKTHLEKVEPKKLSGIGHEQFLNLDNETNNFKKIVDLDQEKREEKLAKALESVGISDGTIIHRSRKLDIDKANRNLESNKIKTTYTTYINKKLPKLYFSMTSIWQEVNSHTFGNGFAIGMMSEYLNSHFHDILAMIYSCGVPSCINLLDMTLEQLAIISAQVRSIQVSIDFPNMLFKAIVNSLRSVLVNNERTFKVLQSTSALELTTLLESYSQVLTDAPPLEEPTRSISLEVFQLLQKYSMINV